MMFRICAILFFAILLMIPTTFSASRSNGVFRPVDDPPPCWSSNIISSEVHDFIDSDSPRNCHGWSSFGSASNLSARVFRCSSFVPDIPAVFVSPREVFPTHYAYCNVVADAVAAGSAHLQQVFGQLVPQLMIGDVEICGGINHSAFGNNTHRTTSKWLAQAQYFFTNVVTGEYQCIGGDIVSAHDGDPVSTSITFTDSGAVSLKLVVGGNTSELLVPYPQLNSTYQWYHYMETNALRPYVSFESWNAANNAAMYPSHPWNVTVFLEPSDGQPKFLAAPQWPRSTAMNVTATSGMGTHASFAEWAFAL
eukprot:m.1348104 g.1348104  ORF g.1348104 m.1348104 type:complete len:308 (+) comp24914_c0_seq5:1867-2790(+)